MKFRIGQKVGCVAAPTAAQALSLTLAHGGAVLLPKVGQKYTIRGGRRCDRCNEEAYVLEEIVNKTFKSSDSPCPFAGSGEVHFDANFFAPLHSRDEQIECLKRLSNPQLWTDEDRKRIEMPVSEPVKEGATP
jgi:hypothetical protein